MNPSSDHPTLEPRPQAGQTGGSGGDSRVFPCEGCGADLRFHIGAQKLRCEHCGFTKQIEIGENAAVAERDYEAMLAHVAELKEKHGAAKPVVKVVACSSCAAQVEFTGNLTSTECAYCGTPVQERVVENPRARLGVDGMLAFAIDRERAAAALSAWVRSRWFAPNDFRKRGIDGKPVGVYLPFWTYDAMTFNQYRGERGEHYWVTVGSGKNRRRVRHTRWYPASGSFQRFFDDVLVPATRTLPERRLTALEPWPLGKCIPHRQEAIAGFLAKTYDIDLHEGFRTATARMGDAIAAEVRRRIGGDEQRIHSLQTRYDAITFKQLLLPVWFLGCRYRDRNYMMLVNAMTAEVQGDRPYSWVKITLASLAGALAIALAVWAMNP